MWSKHAYRPLFWALLLSLLAHLLLIGRLAWSEWNQPASVPIMVELASAPPPPVVPPRAVRPVNKAAPAARPEAVAPPPPEPPSAPVPEVPPAAEAPPVSVMPLVAPLLEKETPASAADVPGDEEQAADAPLQAEVIPPPPSHVRIEYRILRKGGVAGVERHSYLAGEDGRYSLTSVAEPKGLLALALSELVQKSEGAVTPQGLRPATFVYQYGKNPDKAQKAVFDWQAGQLLLETGARKQEVPLTEGAQDLMSFMYQFMFVPPLAEMQLAITNGKRLKTYAYGFDGEEVLDTPFGALNCLHIGRSSDDGEKKTELWLAADYHYLPVRMKETEKDGTVTERVATRLQLE